MFDDPTVVDETVYLHPMENPICSPPGSDEGSVMQKLEIRKIGNHQNWKNWKPQESTETGTKIPGKMLRESSGPGPKTPGVLLESGSL